MWFVHVLHHIQAHQVTRIRWDQLERCGDYRIAGSEFWTTLKPTGEHVALLLRETHRLPRLRYLGGCIKMKRAMVVVDEPFAREMVTLVLQVWGYEVDAVSTCREATNRRSPLEYSLYLIAAALPDGSSIDICRHVRTCNHGTPIVVLSKADADVTLAIETGANSFVIKGRSLVSLLIQAVNLISGGQEGASRVPH